MELFALGSTIYEIWTTRKPYQNDSLRDHDHYEAVLDNFRNQRFPNITGVLSANIIKQCWLDHYTSATEVVIDLEALQKDTQAYSESTVRQKITVQHEYPIALLLSAALVIVLVTMLLQSYLFQAWLWRLKKSKTSYRRICNTRRPPRIRPPPFIRPFPNWIDIYSLTL